MTDRERIRRRDTEDDVVVDEPEAPSVAVDSEEIDDLLDEIDTVLEENAEEFVRNYVQKGGE
jgi:ubiquitin-like protein Pup